MKLSKFQINAVKSMAKDAEQAEKKIQKLEAKKEEVNKTIDNELMALYQRLSDINASVVSYTGGLTIGEVLAPEENQPMNQLSEGSLDTESTADMQEIYTPEMEVCEAPVAEVQEFPTMALENVLN